MFIRETKTTNKKSGKVYTKHTLVESIRTPNGPRQRTVMQLGQLSLPRKSWPSLAAELELRLAGQTELAIPGIERSQAVVAAADMAIAAHGTHGKRKAASLLRETKADLVRVDLNTSSTSLSRSVGPELLAHDAWQRLKMPAVLKDLGLNAAERSVAEAVVAARLIAPDSDLSTWNWIRNSSAIGEFTEKSLDSLGLNRVYAIADRLASLQEKIEAHVREQFQKLYPSDCKLFLFDLTNFHMEGQALGNMMAKRGKSKQKRNDCPLISLAMAVDSRGFPLFSRTYPGNVSEPSTLKEILNQAGLINRTPHLNFDQPIVVMDRGIATKENINLLIKHKIGYILIERGARNKDYLEQFAQAESDPDFIRIKRENQSDVLVKKIIGQRENSVEVLCVSHGKRQKEQAIVRQWEERACEDILQLQQSIHKGSIRQRDKIMRKLGRLDERYGGFSKRFQIELIPDKPGSERIIDLTYQRKPFFEIKDADVNPLLGTYVIETQQHELDAEQIWNLYMTLTRVEASFHALKTDLGTRPIYHQLAARTQGHLFIAVLAYSLLINIEHRLQTTGDHRSWQTIRKQMITHQRSTIILTDENNHVYHIRQTGAPEPVHAETYRKLGITCKPNQKKEKIAKRL